MGNRKCSHTLALPFTHLSYLQAVNRGGRQLSQKLLRPWLSPLTELWASWLVTHVSQPIPEHAPRSQLSISCSNQESPCLNGQARAACKHLFEALERETEQQGSHTHMHMGSLLSGILRGGCSQVLWGSIHQTGWVKPFPSQQAISASGDQRARNNKRHFK